MGHLLPITGPFVPQGMAREENPKSRLRRTVVGHQGVFCCNSSADLYSLVMMKRGCISKLEY